MVGYALNHPSGTYRFYNPGADNIIITNSVKWSNFTPWEASAIGESLNNLKAATNPKQQLDITRTMMNNDGASDFEVVAGGPKAKEPDTDLLDTIAKSSVQTTACVTS